LGGVLCSGIPVASPIAGLQPGYFVLRNCLQYKSHLGKINVSQKRRYKSNGRQFKMKHLTITILILMGVLRATSVIALEPPASTVSAAQGLIQRLLPLRSASQFTVEQIATEGTSDVFEIESRGDRIILRGNNGVAIASALNRYLKEYCHCDISWDCGNQLNLPKKLPLVPQRVRVVSPYKFRYAYNFCTHGYTMAWWVWPKWEHELDFLAMNGINLALIIEGQESVWINTFTNFGYSTADIRGWVVDPAHQPWMAMDNMEDYGGPLSPQLVARRLELGRQIIARMHELGIEPVLPGYYGMVPPNFKKEFPVANVHAQGDWAELKRPDILDPSDLMFAQVAAAFYAAQTNCFGNAQFYDADPFHEGGSTESIDLPACGRAIQKAMDDATWVLQSWWGNPRQEMVDALDKNKVLVLDLNCENHENWRARNNFNGAPWLWCVINCFGGNDGLSGRLAWMGEGPVNAMNEPNKGRMSGIGALMEGSGTIPAAWEMLFENSWRSQVPDLDKWLDGYALRRYGAAIPAAERAWRILADTVYSAPANAGGLPINSVICAHPSLDPQQKARSGASPRPYYDTPRLVEAWKLLLAAAPEAKSSDGYRFDLCDVGRQILADLGTRYDQQIIAAYRKQDAEAVRTLSHKMLGLIQDMNTLVGTRHEFLLGVWLADARSWGTTKVEKDLCERNARELLTTWTSYNNITDYANRQWNGLLGDFYYHRWEMWLKVLNDSLVQGVALNQTDTRNQIRDWELSWTLQTNGHFATKPHGDVIAISKKLFEKYAPDASQPLVPEREPQK
jgi:alpha-N-acetylglucosaminidase